MADESSSQINNALPEPALDVLREIDRRPFGGLEFQVSEVVNRLEAGVAQGAGQNETNRAEPRKISSTLHEPEETPMNEILNVLEDLMIQTDHLNDTSESPLPPMDNLTRAAILSHSLSALFGRLERTHAARIGAHIAGETTRWMAHMFRLSNYSLNAYYHHEHLEGLVRVTRMLLHHRYPRYLEDGALAFSSRLPCIYSCVASPLGLVQHLCRQLGVPLACIRPVPVHPSGRGLDIHALERMYEEDMAAGRNPLMMLGEAGSPPLGCGSPLVELEAFCSSHNIHLHVRGHALALPAALQSEQSFSIADSVTLTPSQWFGVPSLPAVTFYKVPETKTGVNSTSSREGTLTALAGLTGGNGRLPALPLWTVFKAAGSKNLTHRLDSAFRSARNVYAVVANAGLRILSTMPGGDESRALYVVEAMSQASACVAFQFAPDGAEKPPPNYDKMNSWLGLVLQREIDSINVEVCETESHGVVLRYCPLEGLIADEERIEAWAAALEAQLHIVKATLALKEPFRERVEAIPCLRLSQVPGWAGLGGVRYVPPGWEDSSDEELNNLNKQLVDTLRTTDGAFSSGEGEDGLICVRFGMVTADTDVEELLELVISAGKEVEESSRVLTDITEVLKKRIEEAQADLERENLERVWQEGLLRKVPVVGRMVEWWAPAHTPPTPGRRLHLAVGTLQPTDDVYRLIKKKNTENTEETKETKTDAPAS